MLLDDLFARCLFGVFAHWFWLNGFINCAIVHITVHRIPSYYTILRMLLLLFSHQLEPFIVRYMVLRILRRSDWLGSHSRSWDQSKMFAFNFDFLDFGIDIEHSFLSPWQLETDSKVAEHWRVMMWSKLTEEFDGFEAAKGGKGR